VSERCVVVGVTPEVCGTPDGRFIGSSPDFSAADLL
jgi:hypothetical protein